MNLTVSTFNDASTSYFHKSIGGYHGAKMGRYQDLIEFQISKNNMQVLNMLNARYFIVSDPATQTPVAQKNPDALGNAWFVNNYKLVENADSELMALSNFNPREELIVDKRYEDLVKGFIPAPAKDTLDTLSVPSADFVRLTEYQPNKLVYEYSSSLPRLTVFSEIFYSKGWQAYVDGEEAPHFRANYVLRSMLLPAGKHTIEFKFRPQSYYTGEKISFAASAAMVLLLLLSLVYEFYFRKRKEKVKAA
jgi:hypothetical protein